jgi:hypothetical protein
VGEGCSEVAALLCWEGWQMMVADVDLGGEGERRIDG